MMRHLQRPLSEDMSQDMEDILAPSSSEDCSIIMRVEAEIAAARKTAFSYSARHRSDTTDDDDMRDILDVEDDASFDRVLLQGAVSSAEASEEPYFEDEEWQEEQGSFNELETVEESPKSDPEMNANDHMYKRMDMAPTPVIRNTQSNPEIIDMEEALSAEVSTQASNGNGSPVNLPDNYQVVSPKAAQSASRDSTEYEESREEVTESMDRIEFNREDVSSSRSGESREAPQFSEQVDALSGDHWQELNDLPAQESRGSNGSEDKDEQCPGDFSETAAPKEEEDEEVRTEQPPSPSKSDTIVDPILQARLRENLIRRTNEKSIANDIPIASRKIRFRNQFPALKSQKDPREASEIFRDHAVESVPPPFTRFVKAKPDLRKLFAATTASSIMRRSNACGALKVLMSNKKNQMTLIRMEGFLSAMCHAAKDPIPYLGEREQALEARLRATTCLRLAAEPKDNRQILLEFPEYIPALCQVMEEDAGDCRLTACESLVFLAKSPSCKKPMSESTQLLDTLALVLSIRVRTPICSFVDGEAAGNQGNGLKLPLSASSTDSEHSFDSESEEGHDENRPDDESELIHQTAVDESEGIEVHLESVPSEELVEKEVRLGVRQRAQAGACAIVLHLSKDCESSFLLARNSALLKSLIQVSLEVDTPVHTKALEALANISKLPHNSLTLAQHEMLLMSLMEVCTFPESTDRVLALRILQNISGDKKSKNLLATDKILTAIAYSSMTSIMEEKEIAVIIMHNILTEPSTIVPITNTKNFVATLVHLAHDAKSSPGVRVLACEGLATISLWLQTIAGSGKVPKDVPNVPLPTQKATGWMMWD